LAAREKSTQLSSGNLDGLRVQALGLHLMLNAGNYALHPSEPLLKAA
jgi:hypothetical protein